MAKEKPTDKRVKISKAQQQIMLSVLVTSLVFGLALVLSIYFIRVASFNTKVLAAEDESIENYSKSILNIGICKDTDRDKILSKKELEKCNPDSIPVDSIPGTLRYNVAVEMANNGDLESVARASLSDCYDANGKKKDYAQAYSDATTDEEREYQLGLMKMCTALRVVPDALPAQENDEALLASLNEIFIESNWEPESLSPSGSTVDIDIEGLGGIPVSLVVEADAETTLRVLTNIEKSIRSFDPTTATIAWTEGGLNLRAQMTAYYTEEAGIQEGTKTVTAKEQKRGPRK